MISNLFFLAMVTLSPQISLAQEVCPNLTGKFICRYENGNQRLSLKYSQELNQPAVYTVNGTINLIADNVPRQYGANRYQTKCDGDWLSIRQRVVLTNYQGYQVGFAQLLTRWKMSGDSLIETNDGFTVINGVSRLVRTTYFCEKI